ncbi:uncharacterized protein CLUP02_15544 [Colletotrichum lupini]|uniref:Uncharacterized protein n=1 Tax=Colletotrichum lupini TaxID=145971 RepID=A0A9Q8T6A7_9PEZI|nr:uncharacterized protein CLUP02_15544 [Colletotrichum lupini]UQC90013.1 hypothetical protein CLUP02_15544 [Colletotrichum lupini]
MLLRPGVGVLAQKVAKVVIACQNATVKKQGGSCSSNMDGARLNRGGQVALDLNGPPRIPPQNPEGNDNATWRLSGASSTPHTSPSLLFSKSQHLNPPPCTSTVGNGKGPLTDCFGASQNDQASTDINNHGQTGRDVTN